MLLHGPLEGRESHFPALVGFRSEYLVSQRKVASIVGAAREDQRLLHFLELQLLLAGISFARRIVLLPGPSYPCQQILCDESPLGDSLYLLLKVFDRIVWRPHWQQAQGILDCCPGFISQEVCGVDAAAFVDNRVDRLFQFVRSSHLFCHLSWLSLSSCAAAANDSAFNSAFNSRTSSRTPRITPRGSFLCLPSLLISDALISLLFASSGKACWRSAISTSR